ncbi:MAG: hypothetical protein KME37_09575 [Candidatus Thiodiazotropha sp. (ex Codakia orbicularis)]|nr:hypothetical protein [Candidatus Thiodiazotropha sp. (ex Codakia orbicularis)]
MDLDEIIDFANEVTDEIGKFRVDNIFLSPDKLMSDDFQIASLEWDSIPYGDSEIDKVPNDRRGIYAFVIFQENKVFPPHGYVLYIGIAGRNSDRPLRQRYKDYLNSKKVRKRAKIARMIGLWNEVLKFYFAPIDNNVSTDDLQILEKQLNSALLPPCSVGDLDAETKTKRRAF